MFVAQAGDVLGNLVWVIMFMVFMFFYPRLVLSQMIWKLEQSAEMLESMTLNARRIILKATKKRPNRRLRESVKRFFEFFVIGPVSLDPYGIIRKLDIIIQQQKRRFHYFVDQIAPDLDSEEKANLMMGLSAAISLNGLAKLVRHYVELIRKTKNIQLAMVLQMNVPLIERVAKALYRGTVALTNGWPIGDGIGAYVAAELIGDERVREVEEDTIAVRKRIRGVECIIIKAKGPGSRTGRPGKAVEKISKREKVCKIITIDAAVKLEGERTGTVAEGVGVAVGGIGVEKNYIEEVAIRRDIPMDSIVIKMSQEEAIMPMKRSILDASKEAIKAVERSLGRVERKGKVIIVGVGNSCGIGNNAKELEETRRLIKRVWRKLGKKRSAY